ncbi:MAG: hypothetical protein ACLFSB_11195 [Chitinispirillaceae bacterium]
MRTALWSSEHGDRIGIAGSVLFSLMMRQSCKPLSKAAYTKIISFCNLFRHRFFFTEILCKATKARFVGNERLPEKGNVSILYQRMGLGSARNAILQQRIAV